MFCLNAPRKRMLDVNRPIIYSTCGHTSFTAKINGHLMDEPPASLSPYSACVYKKCRMRIAAVSWAGKLEQIIKLNRCHERNRALVFVRGWRPHPPWGGDSKVVPRLDNEP